MELNQKYGNLASDESINRTVAALQANGINKTLIINKEVNKGRLNMIILKEKIGF